MDRYEEKQLQLIAVLEGIGDILVSETGRLKEQRVLQGLDQIVALVRRMFALEQEDPERFHKLMISHKYWRARETGDTAALIGLSIYSSEYLITFSTCLAQLHRVMDAALSKDDQPIIAGVVHTLIKITLVLTARPNSRMFLDETLRRISDVLKSAPNASNSVGASQAIGWYQVCVLLAPDLRGEYLGLLNGYLYTQLCDLIQQGEINLFKSWLYLLTVGGADWPTFLMENYLTDLFGYLKIAGSELGESIKRRKLNEQAKALTAEMLTLPDSGELDTWLERFRQFTESVSEVVDSHEEEERFRRINREITKRVESSNKFQRLLEIFVGVAIFALNRGDVGFIAAVWFHNRSKNSLMMSTAPELIPDDLATLMQLWFGKSVLERPFGLLFNFPLNLRASEQEYFVLLLAHVIASGGAVAEKALERISHPDRLREVIRMPDQFAQAIGRVSTNEDLLSTLQLVNDTALITEKVPNLIQAISNLAEIKLRSLRRDTPMDTELANAHLTEFVRGHDVQVDWLRNIFLRLQMYGTGRESLKSPDGTHLLQYRQTGPRQMFLGTWDQNYGTWFKDWGSVFGQLEEERILQSLRVKCAPVGVENAMKLAETGLHCFLIMSEVTFMQFRDEGTLLPATGQTEFSCRIRPTDSNNGPPLCAFGNQTLPVFTCGSDKLGNEALLLNGLRLGYLYGLEPSETNNEWLLEQDLITMEVNPFPVSDEQKTSTLEREQIVLGSDRSEERWEELNELVEIVFRKRIEFSASSKFTGYRFLSKRSR